jgi:hypothetical protein
MNYYLVVINVFSILSLFYYIRKRTKVQVKEIENIEVIEDEEWLSEDRGFHSFDKKKMLNNSKLKAVMSSIEKDLIVLNDKFDEKFFLSFSLIDKDTLFEFCNIINNTKDPDLIYGIKTTATINAMFYEFDLPSKLFIMDDNVVRRFCQYYLLTKPVTNLIEDVKNDRFNIRESDNVKNFYALLTFVPFMLKILSLLPRGDYPNKFQMLNYLKATHPKQYHNLKGENNVLRLITISFYILEIDIPLDYVFIDSNIRDYILKENAFKFVDDLGKLKLLPQLEDTKAE